MTCIKMSWIPFDFPSRSKFQQDCLIFYQNSTKTKKLHEKRMVNHPQESLLSFAKGWAMYASVLLNRLCYSTVQYSTVQYSTVQYSTVQYSTVQQGWHSCASARHRPFIVSLDAQVSTYAYHYASTWTRMYSQWTKNIPWKIIDNVPFFHQIIKI